MVSPHFLITRGNDITYANLGYFCLFKFYTLTAVKMWPIRMRKNNENKNKRSPAVSFAAWTPNERSNARMHLKSSQTLQSGNAFQDVLGFVYDK